MTQKIDIFFEYDSKNWTFFSIWHKEIELFCWMRLKELNLFSMWFKEFFLTKMTLSILPFLKYDSRIELFLKNYDSQNWTLPINMTHRMEPFFSIWLKELNPFRNITQRTEPFSTYDSKNWTFFSIELFQYYSKDKNFSICFEELNPFLIWPKELTFWKNESNIWTLFEHDSKNWFFSYDSNNWALFWKLAHRIEFFEVILSIEFFFFKKKTQRIERIEPFLEITQRIELFFVENMTQRIELFFSIWLKELLQPFFFMIQILGPFSHDSKNWTFLFTWLKYLNFFWKFLIQRNGPFFFKTQKFSSIKKKSQN